MKPSLCLNMIVKNEGARMERCLRSVLPHVKAASILDTGSTDDTKAVIKRLCEEHGVPVLIGDGPFNNFAQARNDAFAFAKLNNLLGSLPWCQFVLLMDADMEFVVDDPDALMNLDATSPGWDLIQKGGAISYHNRRLVNMNVGKDDIYVGVTHEYIDLPGRGLFTGARFIDHADGSNRGGKYQRDADLLEEALKTEPNNGRYMYYLANTYKDWGKPAIASDFYKTRIDMGGWDEETHSAMMHRANCFKDLKDEPRYVAGMLDAYAFRPSRAEPLYELAKYYRESDRPAVALAFAKTGVKIERPGDLLFVNDYIYEYGLRFEYAIAGYYDSKERNVAFQVTDDLALDPGLDHNSRWACRTNLYWFLKPLKDYCPSFVDKQIDFTPPEGYTAMNPSIEYYNGVLRCNVRTVNYKINEHGHYMIGEKGCHDAPIDTKNFILTLDEKLNTVHAREVVWHRPPAKWGMVTGLEDIRLYRYNGELHFNACVREQASNGTCLQWGGKLRLEIDNEYHTYDDRAYSKEDSIEKNWMPFINGPMHNFVYRLDKKVDTNGVITRMKSPKLHVGDISGSSQLIEFKAGWLCVVHEASVDPTNNKRTYWHRFAWFNRFGELRRLSLPFVFLDKQIEFCAGLAYHPNGNDLVISYGVRDAEAHVATVNIEEVSQMIWKFHEN